MSSNRRFITQLTDVLSRRWRAKAEGRAATILRLLAVIDNMEFARETAQAWLRGELADLDDPHPSPWACNWCGEMISGGREQAREHVQVCRENPLVLRIEALEAALDRQCSTHMETA